VVGCSSVDIFHSVLLLILLPMIVMESMSKTIKRVNNTAKI